MVKRRLLTIACVTGILAFGACGMFDRQPPPPMTLFVGVHTVRVVVTDSSATHQIDVNGLREAVVKELNAPSNQTHFRAVTEGDADCTLTLDIVSEDARAHIQDMQKDGALWNFKALISTTLRRTDGQQLWTKANWPVESTYGFYHLHGREIGNAWIEPGFRKGFNARVSSQLVGELLLK
jgi:hypothetical protein